MNFRRPTSMLLVASISIGLSSLVLAQPAPPPPPPPRIFVPPPPPQQQRPEDRRDHPDDHRGPENGRDDHREQEARDRLIQKQKELRDHRRDARKDEKTWQNNRPQRANDRRKEIEQTWGNNVVNRADARAELSTHADRMARLNRLLDISEDKGDTAMTSHVQNLISAEINRDARVMQDIRSRAGGQ